ncbi:uncharacterized protein B0H18DRAFT_1022280 [Fomitopsis serialis]|uniref:uncharacterized protein n=1 Tax=Fomitopsis serialis TaxID=139415 RepID=UPI0020082882|nr:uncharacterized protein B0H18DRAFT_1022280 [Neoantrodia serialis]KAH9921169.1 hypothetical protein B0H18DRAFT_1022280 [Neoantrodia serialis]
MSYTMSTKLSRASYTVALVGATGGLGVDAVVSLVGKAPNEAAIKSGAKVYFPTEYGSDHRINDFPGWDDPDWLFKGQHARKYRQLGAARQSCFAILIGPWLGFDTANLTYTSVGSPDAKTATTAKADIGRALAELTLLSLNPETAASVPDDVHIAGSNVSYRQVRDVVQKIRDELGVEPKGEIKVQGTDLAAFREKLRKEQLEKPKSGPIDHIKILIGEGKMDFSQNDDELVNPGESIWKWKTVEDIVREKDGKV